MENKKQVGSSSSFTADLSGSKESAPPSESTGIFASIFPRPSRVVGRNFSCSELIGYTQKQSLGNHEWNTKQGTAGIIAKKSEGASNSITNPLSSSLYYGGQEDMYVQSSSTQTSCSYPIFKKDAVDDDPNGNNSQSASRGNWWQGKVAAHTSTRGHFIIKTLPCPGCEYSIYLPRNFTKPEQQFDLPSIIWKICSTFT